MPVRAVASSWQRTTGSASPTATGRIRSGLTAVTVRQIRSAIRRFEYERSRLDTRLALAGCRRERPLPRRKSGNGVAARRVGWIDGKEFARHAGRAWAASGRPSARDAAGDPSLRAAGRPRRMAAPGTDRRQPPCHRIRYLPPCRPAPSTSVGADTTDTTGALVLRRGNRPWRGAYAGADLSRALPGSRPRPRPRSSWDPDQCQSRYGRAGLRRPRRRDDRSRRMPGMAGLPHFWSQIHIAELVHSGYALGH